MELIDVDHLLLGPLALGFLAPHQRAVVGYLVLRKLADLRVGREAPNLDDLACRFHRHLDLAAVLLVDLDRGAVRLRELGRREGPSVVHERPDGTITELLRACRCEIEHQRDEHEPYSSHPGGPDLAHLSILEICSRRCGPQQFRPPTALCGGSARK